MYNILCTKNNIQYTIYNIHNIQTVFVQYPWVHKHKNTHAHTNINIPKLCKRNSITSVISLPCPYDSTNTESTVSAYPHSKFDAQQDPVVFTEDEYELSLRNSKWTQSESDYLLHLCHTYECVTIDICYIIRDSSIVHNFNWHDIHNTILFISESNKHLSWSLSSEGCKVKTGSDSDSSLCH
jgi:hypothetical protein